MKRECGAAPNAVMERKWSRPGHSVGAEDRGNTRQTRNVNAPIVAAVLERYETLSQQIDSMTLARALSGFYVVGVKGPISLRNLGERASASDHTPQEKETRSHGATL